MCFEACLFRIRAMIASSPIACFDFGGPKKYKKDSQPFFVDNSASYLCCWPETFSSQNSQAQRLISLKTEPYSSWSLACPQSSSFRKSPEPSKIQFTPQTLSHPQSHNPQNPQKSCIIYSIDPEQSSTRQFDNPQSLHKPGIIYSTDFQQSSMTSGHY